MDSGRHTWEFGNWTVVGADPPIIHPGHQPPTSISAPERWLGGPVDGVPAVLQPVAHALLQARDDVAGAAAELSVEQLWQRPGRAASAGFHLGHLAGSLDRLFTYARGEALSEAQRAHLAEEGRPGEPPAGPGELVATVDEAVRRALSQLRATPEDSLLDFRAVGRQRLPSNVLGLLFHAAEHSTRHAGQFITTALVVTTGDRG